MDIELFSYEKCYRGCYFRDLSILIVYCAYNLFKIKIYLIIVYNSVKLMLVNYSQATVYVGSGEMEEGGGFLH